MADTTIAASVGTPALTAYILYADAATGTFKKAPLSAVKTVFALVKADVGLGSVDNTADADKPISTAQAAALAGKQATLVSGTNIKTVNGTSLLGSGNITVAGGGGADGKSAYEVAVDNGFSGTEEDWLASLVGPEGPGQENVAQTLTDAATVTWNFANGNFAKVTLGGNRTLSLTNAPTPSSGVLEVIQDGTGSRTLTLPGNVADGFTLSTGAGDRDMLGFIKVASGTYWSGENYSGVIVGDVTAPVFQSATIEDADPADIVLAYNETLDSASVPATSSFTVPGKTVSAVAVSGMEVTVTVSVPFTDSDTPTISYTAGANKIQDTAGNDAANLTTQAITNNIVAVGGGWTEDFDTATPSALPTGWTGSGFITTASATNRSGPNVAQFGENSTEHSLFTNQATAADGTMEVYFRTDDAFSTSVFGIIGRSTAKNLASADQYRAIMFFSAGTLEVRLQNSIAGTPTTIGSTPATAGSLATIWLRLVHSEIGTAHKIRVQRMDNSQYLTSTGTWSATAQDAVTVTNSARTAAGDWGFYAYSTAGGAPDNYIDDVTFS